MAKASHAQNALEERLTFIGIDARARKTLKDLEPVVGASIGPALDHFYERVRATPEVAKFFDDGEHMAGAKARQSGHWELIADGQFDEDYVVSVTNVGKAHARLGLEPRWYIGGYALVVEQLVDAVIRARLKSLFGRSKSDQLSREVGAIVKAAMLDMDYAISVYLDALQAERDRVADERARARADQETALGHLAAALDALAVGDLKKRLSDDLPPEFAGMASNFNAAVEALETAIADVHATSGSIVSGTDGIASASDDLSRRTEQQAASLEESSAALNQLSESVRSTAENAARASSVVSETQAEGGKSEKVVADAVEAMSQIQTSSEQISAIIGVIDEIAFQTNLLALNAGVEAARAGEAGRGFAVVAQEVRSLAQRCTTSAKEIKDLISVSSGHVESGVSLVGDAGKALSSMIGRVDEINALMSGIASAAQEQAQGLREVTTAVGEMDRITQQNAAMVEETTAETSRLKSEAAELAGQLARFQIGNVASGTGGAALAAAAEELRTHAAPSARSHPSSAHGRSSSRRTVNGDDGWEEF